ncbi:Transmembrane protein, partial [Globisporangium splendens]
MPPPPAATRRKSGATLRSASALLLLLVSLVLASAQSDEEQRQQAAHRHVDEAAQDSEARIVGGAAQKPTPLIFQSDVLFQYVPELPQWEMLNLTQYDLPAFAYDTDWSAIGASFQDACVGTFEFLRLWTVFLVLVSVPIVQAVGVIVEALLPHFITVAKIGAEYVREMDPVHQAIVALVLLVVVVCIRKGYFRKARIRYLLFKRNMELRYRSFLASLSDTSRKVAVVLPHALFFVVAYALLYWMPEMIVDFWNNESLFSFFTIGYPLLRTIGVIRHRRLYSKRGRQQRGISTAAPPAPGSSGVAARTTATVASSAKQPQRVARRQSLEDSVWNEWRPYETSLKYWVLWSFASCIVSMVSLLLPGFVLSLLTVPTYLCNIFLAWVHSPITRGDIALYTLLSPLFNPYANRIRDTAAQLQQPENDAANFLMRALVTFRVLPEQHVHFMKDLWSQGPALGGLMFIFTPGFVTARGCLLVGFGFPAYVTMGALAEKTARRYEWWLCYFCVAVAVDYLVTAIGAAFSWVPLFYHAKLLLLMWLQFPYFRGAQRIFDTSFSSVFIHPDRKED